MNLNCCYATHFVRDQVEIDFMNSRPGPGPGPDYLLTTTHLPSCVLRTWWEFGAWCRLVAIPFSSILPWRLQYGRHLEQNCFRFHQNPWPRQDDPLSCIYSIYSLLLDSTRVLAATPPTLGRSLDIGVMTTDIPNSSSPAQQRCWRERDVYN